jgi:hypothetical protein
MSTAQKLIAMGGGFIFAGLLMAIGIMRHWFPDQSRAKRMWAVVVPGLIVGIAME